MKVRFLGFRFQCSSVISLNDFFAAIEAKSKSQLKLGVYDRYFLVNTTHNETYHVGLFVTIKDQRRFCELRDEGGKLKIKVNNLRKNSNLMDFNFFVINKKTGVGLFQHYHNSCSANQFGLFCNRIYNGMRKDLISAEEKKVGEDNLSKKAKNKIKKKYQGTLTWELLVRKESLPQILTELASIRAIELDFAYLQAEEEEFLPLKDYVTLERRKFTFNKKSPTAYIAAEINSLANKLGLKNGRIFGKDIDGIERIVRIYDNLDSFGEYDFDDVAEKLNFLDMDNFEKSWVTTQLITSCKANKHIFEVNIK